MRSTVITMCKMFFAAGFLTLIAISSFSQQEGKPMTRLGTPIEAYEMRPGLILRVRRDASNRVTEIVLQKVGTEGLPSLSILPEEVPNLVDQLFSESLRGNRGPFYGVTSFAGRTSKTDFSYEKLSISLEEAPQTEQSAGYSRLIIRPRLDR